MQTGKLTGKLTAKLATKLATKQRPSHPQNKVKTSTAATAATAFDAAVDFFCWLELQAVANGPSFVNRQPHSAAVYQVIFRGTLLYQVQYNKSTNFNF